MVPAVSLQCVALDIVVCYYCRHGMNIFYCVLLCSVGDGDDVDDGINHNNTIIIIVIIMNTSIT